MVNKKVIFFLIIIILVVISIVMLVFSFLNPRTIIKTNEHTDLVLLDGELIEKPYKLELPPGIHKVEIAGEGFKKVEKEFTVKKYGETFVSLELNQKTAKLSPNLPYENHETETYIYAELNEFLEPVYYIAYVNDRTEAEKWLEKEGITKQNSILLFAAEEDE